MGGFQAPVPPIEITDISGDLNSVCPFIYSRNLASAVDWLLGDKD